MPIFRHSLSRRDAILVLLGATFMHLFTSIFAPFGSDSSSTVINTYIDHQPPAAADLDPLPPPPDSVIHNHHHPVLAETEEKPHIKLLKEGAAKEHATPNHVSFDALEDFPETEIVSHAPGWTVFRNLYMSDGTLFIVSKRPQSYFPPIRMMTSTGLAAENTPENIALREPSSEDMTFITPEEAKRRWGRADDHETNRVLSVEGNTFLINEPSQFLDHYYHFIAEYLLGAWAFWTGTFAPKDPSPSIKDTSFISSIPSISRLIFVNADATGWRDKPGFNAYFFRAAFPSVTVEHQEDWIDRIIASSPPKSPYTYDNPDPNPEQTALNRRLGGRAWHFPQVLFSDRSAAFRGQSCGIKNQRIASEALEAMEKKLPRAWWEPVRKSILKFATAKENTDGKELSFVGKEKGAQEVLPMPEKVVIVYISRQSARRRLIPEDHDRLVEVVTELSNRRGWEFQVVQAEHITKDEQVRIVSRATILLGVHGNGLTHLLLMSPTRVSTVIEIFFPQGFAHDYEWTTRALGMKHFAIWNDTHHTYPEQLDVVYPEGFQGTAIPVYGPTVAQLIEDRVDGKLP